MKRPRFSHDLDIIRRFCYIYCFKHNILTTNFFIVVTSKPDITEDQFWTNFPNVHSKSYFDQHQTIIRTKEKKLSCESWPLPASLSLFIFECDLVTGVGPVVYPYDPLHCQLRRFLFCWLKQNEAVRRQWGVERDGGWNMRKLLIICEI